MFLEVCMFLMCSVLESCLSIVLLMFLSSSHLRCFLLLRHFVLKFVPPRYNGISTVTLKCIAYSRIFLV